MPSGLAFSKDVHNRNNSKDSYQANMNKMGMERGRMCNEQVDQSSVKAMAKFSCKTAAAASTFLQVFWLLAHCCITITSTNQGPKSMWWDHMAISQEYQVCGKDWGSVQR